MAEKPSGIGPILDAWKLVENELGKILLNSDQNLDSCAAILPTAVSRVESLEKAVRSDASAAAFGPSVARLVSAIRAAAGAAKAWNGSAERLQQSSSDDTGTAQFRWAMADLEASHIEFVRSLAALQQGRLP